MIFLDFGRREMEFIEFNMFKIGAHVDNGVKGTVVNLQTRDGIQSTAFNMFKIIGAQAVKL